MPLQFRREDRDRVAKGEITVTYRLWRYARVKAGKTYPTGFGEVFVEDVQLLPAALIDETDAAAAGFRSVEEGLALRRRPHEDYRRAGHAPLSRSVPSARLESPSWCSSAASSSAA